MIPANLEYMLVLLIGAATGLLIFHEQIRRIMANPRLYPPLAIFTVASFGFDLVGMSQGWWHFSWYHLIGVSILGVPVEEIFLFVCAFIMTAAAWHFFSEE